MADDERRAEIEAVAAILRGWGPTLGRGARTTEVAQEVVSALDRLRDARGDDEAARYAEVSLGPEAVVTRDDMLAARSPQGEGHEAGDLIEQLRATGQRHHRWTADDIESGKYGFRSPSRDGTVAVEVAIDALDSIEGYAQRLSDDKGWGATRLCIQEEARKVRAILAEFSPASTGDREDAPA